MIQSGDKKALREKHAELVEFLRNNLPDGAKKLVVEHEKLITYKDESGRLPVIFHKLRNISIIHF